MFVKPGHLTYVHSICCTYCKNEVNRNTKRKDLPLYSYKEDLSKYQHFVKTTVKIISDRQQQQQQQQKS